MDSRVVGCDGGGGALGHPLVYLNMGDEDEIACPYCSRHFVFEGGTAPVAGH
ncbi:MAG TPA: zinc-finger domain-containing protein [Rhodospirillales bacterium]|nr:zinc-finger domain-containing protein [Rhodospirillales bacterium]